MSEQSKPEPAVGQVRRGRLAYQAYDVLWVVVSLDAWALVRQDGFEGHACVTTDALRAWPCVGVETPAGRVMVGERRRPTGGGSPTTVLAIVAMGVSVSLPGGLMATWGADVVASWLFVSTLAEAAKGAARSVADFSRIIRDIETAGYERLAPEVMAQRLGIPLPPNPAAYKHPAGCLCTWEEGDSACPEHPTCPECGCVTCECSRGSDGSPMWSPGDLSPEATKQARRCEIDAILRDDARRFPAFATARRAAVMAAFEGAPPVAPEDIVPVEHAYTVVRRMHDYDDIRGGRTKPNQEASTLAVCRPAMVHIYAAYERARSLP